MKINADSFNSMLVEANTQFVGVIYSKDDACISHISKGVLIASSKPLVISGSGAEYTTDYPDVLLADKLQIVLKKEHNGITYTVLSSVTSATCNKLHAV